MDVFFSKGGSVGELLGHSLAVLGIDGSSLLTLGWIKIGHLTHSVQG